MNNVKLFFNKHKGLFIRLGYYSVGCLVGWYVGRACLEVGYENTLNAIYDYNPNTTLTDLKSEEFMNAFKESVGM